MTSAASPPDQEASIQGSPFEKPQALLALIKEADTRSSTSSSSEFPEELLKPFSNCPNLISELVGYGNDSNIHFYFEYGLVSARKIYNKNKKDGEEAFLNHYVGLLKELQIKKYISLDVSDLSKALPQKLKESGIEHLVSEKFFFSGSMGI